MSRVHLQITIGDLIVLGYTVIMLKQNRQSKRYILNMNNVRRIKIWTYHTNLIVNALVINPINKIWIN